MALTIICAIMVFLAPTLLASPVDGTGAQAIFAVLGGWGGVVIGYYFGRIPAEKVAEVARSEKDRAEKDKVNEIISLDEKLAKYERELADLIREVSYAEEIIKKSDNE